MVSDGYSVVQQGRFGKEGHGQWSVSRPAREIWKRRPRSVVSQSSSKGDLEKKVTVSGQSVVQQERFGKEGHGQWSVSRPAGTFPKEGHDGYSVVQQGDLEKRVMVSEGSVVQQAHFQKNVTMVTQSSSKVIWKMQWSVMVTQSSSKKIWKRGSWSVKGQSSSRHISKRTSRWLLSRPARSFGKCNGQ